MAEDGKLRRGIGLGAAVFVIVGLVIGSSIWLLPTEALAEAGPGMFVGYILAVIPGILLALLCAYLGSAAPSAGGTYVLISRTLGSLGGALAIAVVIAGAGGAVAFMAGTFGIFVNSLGVSIPVLITGTAILIVAYLVNILRVEVSATVAMIITLLGDVLVILLFIAFGLPHVDTANLTPLFPMGFGAVVQASILFIFSYAGFTAVLDIGGEIKNPTKNIPRALGLSLLILVALYTVQAFVVAGTVPWQVAAEEIESTGTFTVAQVAEAFVPAGIVRVMPVLILIAIASTIFPMILSYSRDFLMAGRDQLLPRRLGRINRRFSTPIAGLTVFTACSLLLFLLILVLAPALELPLQVAVDLFAAISVSGVLIAEILLAVAALRAEARLPEPAPGRFKLGKAALWIVAVLAILSAAGLLVLLAMEEILIMIVLLVLIVPILVYFFLRKAYLARRGIDLDKITSQWPEDVTA
jgi:APA family basic amino acid/polyamine antiporter